MLTLLWRSCAGGGIPGNHIRLDSPSERPVEDAVQLKNSSVAQLVGPPITDWQQSQTPLEDLPVATFQPLMKRIESSQIDALQIILL